MYKGQSLRCSPGRGNHIHCVAMLYVEEGLRGNSVTCSALSQFSVISPTSHNQIGPFWCWFLGGWACVRSRTMWVSPMNSPVMLGVSPAAPTPTGFFSQRPWDFISPHWNPGLCILSCSPVVPPGLSACKCGIAQPASHLLLWSSSCSPATSPLHPAARLHPSYQSGCFFFNSLVVKLPYSSIFPHFWLFFVFIFFVVLLLVVQKGKVYLPSPPSWLEVLH